MEHLSYTGSPSYTEHVAKLGVWVIGSLEDGPEDYRYHVDEMYETIAEIRHAGKP